METLAYLHLVLVDEAPTDAIEVYSLENLKLFEWFKQQKIATNARMYLLLLIAILGIFGMAGEAIAQTLRIGDRSPEVRFIQQRLQQLGYLNAPADGVFGSTTRNAVIRFQQDNRLIPDGEVGSATESALFAEYSHRAQRLGQEYLYSRPDQVLRQGDRGSEVTAVQQRLQQLGYFNRTPTEFFGPITQESVIRFQRDNNIETSGVVDARTRAVLFSAVPSQSFDGNLLGIPYPPPPTGNVSSERFSEVALSTRILRLGDRGSEVVRLQQELRQRGFNPGRVDGIFGRQTEDAVIRFQRSRGLFPDGVAGRDTLTVLNLIDQPRRNRYVVVVPVRDNNTLFQVRAVEGFNNAVIANSQRGRYVNAGAFPNRASAESRSYLLRSRGLDARVAYF
jgi:peptidoglycan hydrolase-like protein with peptidoglycan-binding domain